MDVETGTGSVVDMKVLVFGANGPTGQQITKQALDAGHAVTAVTRHPEALTLAHPELTVVKGDATDAASVGEAVRGHDAVLSALGVPYSRHAISLYSSSAHNIIAAMTEQGVRRLIGVTSANVDPSTRRHGSLPVRYLLEPLLTRIGRTLYEDMGRMEKVIRASELDWTVVRPPALCDADHVGNFQVSEEPLPGTFATRPDVASFLVSQLADDRFSRKIASIASPDAHPNILKIIWKDGITKR